MAWVEAYLPTKWQLDPSSRLATTYMGRKKSNRKRKRIRYPHCIRFIRSMRKQKAILWKRWKLSNAPEDKLLYKTAAVKCKNAIDKFHIRTTLAVSLVLLIIG